VLCADNARFMNHADEPNTTRVHIDGAIEDDDIATRDIRVGEEMTCDYRLFDADEFW
jgi:SET domain-containing protein